MQTDYKCIVGLILVIIIIIIRHELSLDIPVSASSNILLTSLPGRLRPTGLQFSIIFVILLPLILVTWCSQFDFYFLSFSSTGSSFNSYKIS